jgi:Zn-dependent peptidase ImmA (M78 family)
MPKSDSLLEKQADEFRQQHNIGDKDPIRFKSLLSNLNVISSFQTLSPEFSGMAIKVSEPKIKEVRLMMVNSNHSLGKQHFTICHELYHLYVQEDFTSMCCQTAKFDKKSGVEFDADRFAAHLLLPKQGLLSLIPNDQFRKNKISIATLLKIEHYYSCSRAALWYRLKELNLLGNDTFDHYCSNVKKSAIAHGYSLSLYEAGNENLSLGDYGSLAKKLLEEGKISESHYISLLHDWGIPLERLQNLFSETPSDD